MKLTALLTSAALVAFVSFIASLAIGAGILPLLATSATLFVLAGMVADYSRTPRVLVPAEAVASRVSTLRLAA